MAFASDRLKEYRKNKISPGILGNDEVDGEEEKTQPSDRSVMLTDMEQKSLGGSYMPGETVTCEVTGRLSDGKLDIVEIRPAGGGVPEKPAMAPPPMMSA